MVCIFGFHLEAQPAFPIEYYVPVGALHALAHVRRPGPFQETSVAAQV